MRKLINPIPKEELYKLYIEQNIIVKEIAKINNCSIPSIERILRKYKIKKPTFDIDKDTLYDLYINKKLSATKISKLYGCSQDMIYIRLKKYNIEIIKNRYFIDLTGKRFGKLVVESISKNNKNNNTRWNCLCDCGAKTKTSTSNFLYRNVKACQKCANIAKTPYGRYEEIPNEYIYRVRKNAINRGHIFSISIEYSWDLFLKQNRKCALSGIELNFTSRSNMSSMTASLDRIDSSKGYIEGNVQWVHKLINRMKMDLSDSELIDFCHQISDYQRFKNVK